MAKFELTIEASYLPGWGLFEGCREVIANARDAETQFNAPMTIKFAERTKNGKKVGALIITNQGTFLPKETLLIGHSTKRDDSRTIGVFGEGMKYGVMALLRLGLSVKIRNGSEVWVPSIERSEKYNADVLVFNTTKGHKDEKRVQFEIVGMDESDWQEIEKKLLFIGEYPESVEVFDGHVLTSPQYQGQLFVKGMFVAQTQSHFGYDFKDADIDRDRRMINEFASKTSDLLAQAVNKNELASQVFELLQDGSEEASHITNWRLDENACKTIATEFQRANPGVIPVETLAEKQELESFGKKAQQVSWNIRTILESQLGKAGEHLRQLRRSDKKQYALSELTQFERDNLRFIVSTVGRACQKLGDVVKTLDDILIVDFAKADRIGTYDPNTGNIRLARSIMESKGKALYTLVHEVAHSHGGDGVRSHEEAIGNIMEKILDELL